LSAEQVEFFTAHEEIGTRVTLVDQALLARYSPPTGRQLITRAVRLSYEFELMFYDTIIEATLR